MRFDVLTAVHMKFAVFWDMPPYSLVYKEKVPEEFAASIFRRDECLS
jgi:hypothetical protein